MAAKKNWKKKKKKKRKNQPRWGPKEGKLRAILQTTFCDRALKLKGIMLPKATIYYSGRFRWNKPRKRNSNGCLCLERKMEMKSIMLRLTFSEDLSRWIISKIWITHILQVQSSDLSISLSFRMSSIWSTFLPMETRMGSEQTCAPRVSAWV